MMNNVVRGDEHREHAYLHASGGTWVSGGGGDYAKLELVDVKRPPTPPTSGRSWWAFMKDWIAKPAVGTLVRDGVRWVWDNRDKLWEALSNLNRHRLAETTP